ncbi:hypothetical protein CHINAEXTREME_20460 (plasmid) [Halobiforma lacisalsi AJ5]|uniref:Uncharacterized protein n=1 Tax=Natronobacterium lacisalsi AJ5 TaxID=358396 RepID=M0LV91_NATLA|nr:hypothetical protein [Halobiforma lacisalsi]APX00188.1 hypothetical protein CHINAEXTREME_20460 [Halobiforma lacisalsi AJ5]EMA37396.1 hypothetical protein C445_00866 [Halobiforma lacisalsi AJ5]
MDTHTCSDCGEPFDTRANYLARNAVCPDCFEFPDVHHDETPDNDHTVYLVASVSAGMHGAFHAAYFRVAAQSEADARFFAIAYQRLEDTVNEPSLADIAFDGEELVLIRPGAAPTTVRVVELPVVERHDGYAVTKLDTRNGDDYEDQLDFGPNTTDKLPDPDMTPKDVLVHATDEQIEHKLEKNVPDDHQCYWTVNGTPQQTRFGQRIWFEQDGQLVACGQIRGTESGRIWFSPLWEVDLECPTTVPNQGYKYVEPIDTGQRTPERARA